MLHSITVYSVPEPANNRQEALSTNLLYGLGRGLGHLQSHAVSGQHEVCTSRACACISTMLQQLPAAIASCIPVQICRQAKSLRLQSFREFQAVRQLTCQLQNTQRYDFGHAS